MWFGQNVLKTPTQKIHGPWRSYATRIDALLNNSNFVSILPLACTVNDYNSWMAKMASEGKDPRKCRPNFPFYGPFYADFDSNDLPALLTTIHDRLSYLKKWGLKDENFQLWFSGKKGVHLLIDPALFGASGFSHPYLPDIYKEMAKRLNLSDIMDKGVYSKGRGRLWRVEGDLRGNGCRKIPLQMNELLLTVEELYEKARQPYNKKPKSSFNLVQIPALAACFQRSFQNIEAQHKVNRFNRFQMLPFLGRQPASSLRQIQIALQSIPLHLVDDYDTWIKIGMALHQESNGQEWGLNLWEIWSKQSHKYHERELRNRWDTFAPVENGVTIRTLFYFSRKHL